ncbi:MAG: MHS family MFS transporter [Deltaproteobacteria bacterium]|nr:MHS family MFS transporter [Deltaproteobacteria bacterium]
MIPQDQNRQTRRSTIAGIIGNILEWYDFAVFGYYAPIIGTLFFPSESKYAALIKAYGVFAAGYMMRPIGGAIFGHMGDRVGRKKALQVSILMMAIPTACLGLVPSYDRIGLAAPLILIFLRLLQGLSVGGEFIGSMSFSAEIAPPNRRGFYGSLTTLSAVGGIMLGSAVATAMQGLLSQESMLSWGWRVPFLAGIAIAGFGLWMRKGMIEPPAFKKLKTTEDVHKSPVIQVIRHMPGRIGHTAALVVLFGGGFYMLFVWWPTYLTHMVKPAVPHALMINTIVTLVMLALIPLSGYWSDRVGRKKMLVASCLSIAVVAYPLFTWSDHGVFQSALVAQLIFALIFCNIQSSMPATLAEMFPTGVRFSGIALGYNLTLALVGGTAPMVCTWLVTVTGDIASPAYYLIIMALVSFVAAIKLRPMEGVELDQV